MKRRWRLGRIILAVLLLGLAALAYYVWPIGPSWTIDREQLVGFDLNKGLLFTAYTSSKTEHRSLRGIDLSTGERRYYCPFTVEIKKRQVPPNDFETSWQTLLSSDCSKMVCYDRASSIQVFDVQNQCRRLFSIPRDKGLDSIGFSVNGDLLAFGDGDDVQVWDCKEGKTTHRLKLPVEHSAPLRIESIFDRAGGAAQGSSILIVENKMHPHPGRLQFSRDRRYLAVAGNNNSIVVFDLSSGSVMGQCPNSRIPHFLADNKTLVAFPGSYPSKKGDRYAVDGDKLNPLSTALRIDSEQESQTAASIANLMTYRRDNLWLMSLPDWIRIDLREKLEDVEGSWLDWTPNAYFLQKTDTSKGQSQYEFKFRLREFERDNVYPEGLKLLIADDDHVSLWDIPPRHSLTCWLICCGIAFIAVLLAWPRRVILT